MKSAYKFIKPVIALLIAFALTNCASTPKAPEFAKLYQANLQYYQGSPFKHAVFVNPTAFSKQTDHTHTKLLHVYIEGDGIPFIDPKTAALDPTPDTPLMLKLMQMDKNPSIYLGRPCYFDTKDKKCSPIWWTHNRYSQTVVDSMLSVLKQFEQQYDGFVVIGYSGGGTVAMLMSEHYKPIKMLVTLAGNLNPTEWTYENNFTALMGSLNPATRPSLDPKLIQLHYAGEDDDIIKADWIQTVAEKQSRAEFHILKETDHTCCWESFWPTALKKLSQYRAFTR